MSENKFWIAVWSIAAIGLVSFTAVLTHYHSDKNTKIVQAIKDGADPLELICALDSSNERVNPTCIIIANKEDNYGTYSWRYRLENQTEVSPRQVP